MDTTRATCESQLLQLIRDVPDFPKPGIVYKDITPLLRSRDMLAMAVDCMAGPFRETTIDCVVGAESRGFIFGTALAGVLRAGFVPIRKPGKLPAATISETYALEYGTDTLEVHEDAIAPGDRVLLVDDLLATGGTMAACASLVTSLGGTIVGVSVLVELTFLNGRAKLEGHPVHSVLPFDGA